MPNGTYGGVRGRKTEVGRKLSFSSYSIGAKVNDACKSPPLAGSKFAAKNLTQVPNTRKHENDNMERRGWQKPADSLYPLGSSLKIGISILCDWEKIVTIDICKSFMIYFQIFTTFGYKNLKNSDTIVFRDSHLIPSIWVNRQTFPYFPDHTHRFYIIGSVFRADFFIFSHVWSLHFRKVVFHA